MDPRGLKVTKNAYFSLLTGTKQLLLMTFCDTTAELVTQKNDRTKDGWTDVKFEIVL